MEQRDSNSHPTNMPSESIVILPGLDGTDQMLGEFCRLCAETALTKVLTLPSDTSLDYPALAKHFSSEIRRLGKCHVIAESFSGPIGILLAREFPQHVSRLTLVASFARSPVPRIAVCLPWSVLFRLPLPSFVSKRYFVGQTASLTPRLRSAIRQNSIEVLRHRLKLVQQVDVLAELSEIECPVTYLRATNDRLVSKRCLDEILAAKPSTTVHEVVGPHLVLETQPEVCWRVIVGET